MVEDEKVEAVVVVILSLSRRVLVVLFDLECVLEFVGEVEGELEEEDDDAGLKLLNVSYQSHVRTESMPCVTAWNRSIYRGNVNLWLNRTYYGASVAWRCGISYVTCRFDGHGLRLH